MQDMPTTEIQAAQKAAMQYASEPGSNSLAASTSVLESAMESQAMQISKLENLIDHLESRLSSLTVPTDTAVSEASEPERARSMVILSVDAATGRIKTLQSRLVALLESLQV